MKRLLRVDKTINNKGFSLVELLIAVAIASIVGASVFGFMTVGAKTFGSESTDVHLQNEAQLAFNQIQDLMIDTVVGIDYVYVADDFSDDSHKITTDAELPATIKGKKLIMYNTSGSGRNIYEIVWKADDQKLYYNEYTVAVDDVSGTVSKGSHIGETDALMAEYVTGFSADLSLVESKRVARIEISYEKDGRPYVSSHNITLRNKIVSGNKVPQFMVSENIVHLSASINGPSEIFVEPGDVCMLNGSYDIIDDTGVVTSATKNWYLDPSTVDINTQLSTDGQLQVSNAQKNDFTITVKSGDGLASKDIDVRIIRITTIDGISWEHTGAVGKGEISGGSTPTADDLIADETFKLTVTGMSGTHLDETSFNGHTVEKKVVFIKTKGAELFEITSQDGISCQCKMNTSLNSNTSSSSTSSDPEDVIQWTTNNGNGSQSYKTTDIEVTAVSLYSMGGRGYSEPTDPDIALSDFDYTAASSLPTSVGSTSYVGSNRYYESGIVKPVALQWGGKAYATSSNFNIGVGDWQRGDHYPVSVMYNGKAGDLKSLTTLSDGTTIDWTKYFGIIDITLTEKHHTQDGSTQETVTKHYCPDYLTRGEGTHWGILCPEDYSANSDFIYTVVAYLIDKSSVTCNVNAGDCAVYGQVAGISESDLTNAKYKSNTLTVEFSRLTLAFERSVATDSNITVSGDKNQYAAFYPKEYGEEYDWDTQYTTTIGYTYMNQFNKAKNNFIATQCWNYYQEKNGGWVFYEGDDRLFSTGTDCKVQAEANDGKIKFTYQPREINKDNTPSHLRLVPSYIKDNTNEVIFGNHIDVWIWNVVIPTTDRKLSNGQSERVIDEQVSYFPVPSDVGSKAAYEAKYLGTNQAWKGALAKDKNNNKKTTAIYYTLTRIGEANADKPSYKLTLKYIDPDTTKYVEIASYECSFDGHEWVKK